MPIVTLTDEGLMTIIIRNLDQLPKGFKVIETLPDGRMRAIEIVLPPAS